VAEDVVGGAVVPVQVRVRECYSALAQPVGSTPTGTADEFQVEEVVQVRVLELVDGVYRQRVYTQEDGGNYGDPEEVVPTVDATPLDAIPFYVFQADSSGRPDVR
jgi:hypothetical protein